MAVVVGRSVVNETEWLSVALLAHAVKARVVGVALLRRTEPGQAVSEDKCRLLTGLNGRRAGRVEGSRLLSVQLPLDHDSV